MTTTTMSVAFREAVFGLLVAFVSGVGFILCFAYARNKAGLSRADSDAALEMAAVEVAATVPEAPPRAGAPKLVIAVPHDRRGAPLANVLLVGPLGDDRDIPKGALV